MKKVYTDKHEDATNRQTSDVVFYLMNWEDPDAYAEIEQLHFDFHRIVHQVMPWAIMDFDTL